MRNLAAICETIRIKIQKKTIFWGRKFRQNLLTNNQFTIISNNCWGGRIYQSYGMQNLSPTIGMVIYPEDYVKFCADIHKYLAMPLEFILMEESKYRKQIPKEKRYPVACLGDIELHFLHYHTEQEAREKWMRRTGRICWDCIIYKFNDQNGCTKELLREFCSLPLENKLCFVCNKNKVEGAIVIKQLWNGNQIRFSNEPYGHNRQFNVTKYLNTLFQNRK